MFNRSLAPIFFIIYLYNIHTSLNINEGKIYLANNNIIMQFGHYSTYLYNLLLIGILFNSNIFFTDQQMINIYLSIKNGITDIMPLKQVNYMISLIIIYFNSSIKILINLEPALISV
ncbi:unnamed protein product [Chrysodeixis includens]|uniref:Uncharacterized protein n=1 Tax=Chrysodeixis includens TaxID=689277 RepID=A0A9N8KVL3_CHRIL|nr:unnamed protein product [Chrysodeixis includens]